MKSTAILFLAWFFTTSTVVATMPSSENSSVNGSVPVPPREAGHAGNSQAERPAGITGLDRWTFIHADADRLPAPGSKARGAFGIGFGDLNGDGMIDIASGRYFYRNPGGDMTKVPWPRVTLPSDPVTGIPVDAGLLFSVTGHGPARDIIAEDLPDIVWLHADDAQGNTWTARVVAHMPRTNHGNGRSIRAAHIVPGDVRPDVLLTGGGGLYLMRIPADPTQGPWPIMKITYTNTDEPKSIGIADIDGDGIPDLVLDGGGRNTRIDWWRNPGDGSDHWVRHHIGNTINHSKMVAVADINGDGHTDVVATGSESKDSHLFWFESPANPMAGTWIRHEVAHGYYGLDSLSAADMNGDGQPDIVIGETKGRCRLVIYENVGGGRSWFAHVISRGRESHKGAQVVDLNGDGYSDIVSICYFHYKNLYVWRNDNRPTHTSQ